MTYLHARYNGIQKSLCPGLDAFALWTIWEDIPGHPTGSTVVIETIREAGFEPVQTDD